MFSFFTSNALCELKKYNRVCVIELPTIKNCLGSVVREEYCHNNEEGILIPCVVKQQKFFKYCELIPMNQYYENIMYTV